ncbi:hypothetical protein V6N13_017329 [Hibiscus sabdariffa]
MAQIDGSVDWRKLFGGVREQTLDFFPPTITDGLVRVQPPREVFAEGVEDWKFSLVGQFIGPAPNFSAMQKIVGILWGKMSTVKVSIAGTNLYVFTFVNATARDWVLENGPWHIQHKPLVLRRWEPNLQKLDFDLQKMQIWVQLHNVPLELFSRKGLSYIASAIGSPLYMDSVTASRERLEFAKVCVEITAGVSIPKWIEVQLGDGSFASIRVFVPWLPSHCSKCCTFGHGESSCSLVEGLVVNRGQGSSATRGEGFGANLNVENLGVDNSVDDGALMEGSVDLQSDVNTVQADMVIPNDGSKKKKPRGRPAKGDKKGGFGSSANKFASLAGSEEVIEGMVRKQRVAAQGVAALLQDIKTKKKDQVDKLKAIKVDDPGIVCSSSLIPSL